MSNWVDDPLDISGLVRSEMTPEMIPESQSRQPLDMSRTAISPAHPNPQRLPFPHTRVQNFHSSVLWSGGCGDRNNLSVYRRCNSKEFRAARTGGARGSKLKWEGICTICNLCGCGLRDLGYRPFACNIKESCHTHIQSAVTYHMCNRQGRMDALSPLRNKKKHQIQLLPNKSFLLDEGIPHWFIWNTAESVANQKETVSVGVCARVPPFTSPPLSGFVCQYFVGLHVVEPEGVFCFWFMRPSWNGTLYCDLLLHNW